MPISIVNSTHIWAGRHLWVCVFSRATSKKKSIVVNTQWLSVLTQHRFVCHSRCQSHAHIEPRAQMSRNTFDTYLFYALNLIYPVKYNPYFGKVTYRKYRCRHCDYSMILLIILLKGNLKELGVRMVLLCYPTRFIYIRPYSTYVIIFVERNDIGIWYICCVISILPKRMMSKAK